MDKTATHKYADIRLGQPLEQYVADKRKAGVSWRRISLDLRDETNGDIDVTYETLRAWFPELVEAAS